jgi:hypothetical protein
MGPEYSCLPCISASVNSGNRAHTFIEYKTGPWHNIAAFSLTLTHPVPGGSGFQNGRRPFKISAAGEAPSLATMLLV